MQTLDMLVNTAFSGSGVRYAPPAAQVLFFMVLGAGVIFLSVLLYFTADIQFQRACIKVLRRLFKTVALRQACTAHMSKVHLPSWYGLGMQTIGRTARLSHGVLLNFQRGPRRLSAMTGLGALHDR